MNRRSFLRSVAGGIGLGTAGSLLTASGCQREEPSAAEGLPATPYAPRSPQQTGAVRDVQLVARLGEVEVGPGQVYRTWLYNDRLPGPEIRAQEGDRLRIVVQNELPEDTTVHWHGIPVPNEMDGVPGLTQEPIAAGESFTYDFIADPAGSYVYHSHVGLQIDRGLVGSLVVEERQPHVEYDREHSLVLDDYLAREPAPLRRSGGMMGRGRGGMRGGMMGGQIPSYEGVLANGKLPSDPPLFETSRGERIRLRLFNLSGATAYRFAVAGHRLLVTHADGRPVAPVSVDALHIGMGERYDVVVEANNPGAWIAVAAPLEARLAPATAILRYTDAAQARPALGSVPDGIRGGRVLELHDLKALEPIPALSPDRLVDMTLSGGMMSPRWTINGRAYPNADPVDIHEGEVVRVRMINQSMMLHPMHLHGHFFRVGNALKDTVIVPPHMGRVTFDFLADNPGRWLFHCHNIYHLEAGMAREIRYVGTSESAPLDP